jgi:ABC-type methionine transport system ATPase subunit
MEPAISVRNVCFRSRSPSSEEQRDVLTNVSFDVAPGEIYGVIGPSGAGKTTLLRLMNGLDSPDAGAILLDGVDTSKMDVLALRRSVGMVFQSPALFRGTVASNVEYALALRSAGPTEREAGGLAALSRVGLPDSFWTRDASRLSRGEQQRVSIARALAAEPRVLLMDEPTSALDPTSASRILALVRALNETTGVTVVFVTHLMAQAREVCGRALVLVEGRGVEEGGVPGILDAPRSELTRLFVEGKLTPEAASCDPRGGGGGAA